MPGSYVIQGTALHWKRSLVDGRYRLTLLLNELPVEKFYLWWGFKDNVRGTYDNLRFDDVFYLRSNRDYRTEEQGIFGRAKLNKKFRDEGVYWPGELLGSDRWPNRVVFEITHLVRGLSDALEHIPQEKVQHWRQLTNEGKSDQLFEELERIKLLEGQMADGTYKPRAGSIIPVPTGVANSIEDQLKGNGQGPTSFDVVVPASSPFLPFPLQMTANAVKQLREQAI